MQSAPVITTDEKSQDTLAKKKLKDIAKNWQIIVGATIIATFVIVALFAPLFAPMDPLEISVQRRLQPPSPYHLLGTDALGRDMLSRIIFGTRISLVVGVASTFFGAVVGVAFGVISGYYGGRTDSFIMRFVDVLLAFPGMLLALAIVAILGASTQNTIIAVSIFAVPIFARIVRGSVLAVKKLEYIDAIRAMGATDARIILRHILPNIMSPIIVQATLYVASAIVIAASLSFLGMGTQPPTPEWGTMLSDGREFLRHSPHLTLYPGIMILLVVLGFNLIGDGLRDALEPKK
ncbi:MAG: ABC transporter permease [Defluviitaleaceae bacterium]|nr:ABC transporter permease [Defluviitaleaceae bacterium]